MDAVVYKTNQSIDEKILNDDIFLDELKRPFNQNGHGSSYPIYSSENPEEFWGAIQISTPLEKPVKGSNVKRARIFRTTDDLILEIYAKVVGLLIGLHYKEWLKSLEIARNDTFNDIGKDYYVNLSLRILVICLLNAKNLQELLASIQTKLPKYFGFEAVGILFLDSKKLFITLK